MVRYIGKRLLMMIPVLLGIVLIVFCMNHISSGNPARMLLGVGASYEEIASLEEELGLNDPLYVQKVGRYYSWAAATRLTWDEAKAAYEAGQTVQGVCPEGWHLPSMDEFNALREYLGADGANAVKDPSYWPTTAGITNSAKMNVAVSGFYWHEGLTFLTDPTFTARFWTSTPRLRGMQFAYGDSASADDPTKAVLLSIYDDASTLNMQSYSIVPSVENHMYPIRCVMDPM